MKTINYDALQVEQAWLNVSEQLQQRNNLLSQGISRLERQAAGLPIASRLLILRYHLRHSLRRLTAETRQLPKNADDAQRLHQQWMHVHQLHFLLRQIDTELHTARADSNEFGQWLASLETRVYRSALVRLN
jgi:hypothetical protein